MWKKDPIHNKQEFTKGEGLKDLYKRGLSNEHTCYDPDRKLDTRVNAMQFKEGCSCFRCTELL